MASVLLKTSRGTPFSLKMGLILKNVDSFSIVGLILISNYKAGLLLSLNLLLIILIDEGNYFY